MLDNILGNKTNLLVLRFLARFQDQFFPADEIARETGAGLKNVYDSLTTLRYEGVVTDRKTAGKSHYRFVPDSIVKELILRLFEEDKKRLFIRTMARYKTLAELESKLVKRLGGNLIDIILFGSVAKGRDIRGSDLDVCVIVAEHDASDEDAVRRIIDQRKLKNTQCHVFASDEFIDAHKRGNALVNEILRDGLSLKMGK